MTMEEIAGIKSAMLLKVEALEKITALLIELRDTVDQVGSDESDGDDAVLWVVERLEDA